MTIKNLDKYLDPPDEPEVHLCESCGHKMMQYLHDDEYYCNNKFCPEKHIGILKEMAELIVDQAETIDELKTKIRRLERKHEV